MSEALILPQFIPPTPDLSNYALKSHSHSGYASSSHSHTGYASSSHTHDMSAYATQSWVTNNFAPKGSGGSGSGDSSTSQVLTITRKLTKGTYTASMPPGTDYGSKSHTCNGTIKSARVDSMTVTPSTVLIPASNSLPSDIPAGSFLRVSSSYSSFYFEYGFEIYLDLKYSGSILTSNLYQTVLSQITPKPYSLSSDVTITLKVTVYF